MTVPVLETERLRLRGHRTDDFPLVAALWADPEVTRYIGGQPFTGEESWSRLLRYAGHWECLGFGYWVIEQKLDGSFLGEVGFADYKRGIDVLQGVPEIGWVLASNFHGKGYATEAVKAVVEWGDRHFGDVRTACIIHPENAASVRVARKCGYREAPRANYKGHEVLVMVR